MKKIIKIILDLFLALIFKSRVYISEYVQSCVKLQMIILVDDKFILVKDGDRVKIPSVEVNLAKKHSIVFTVKKFLKQNISKKINSNNYMELRFLDYCREMVSINKEKNLFVDNVYIKLSINDILNSDDLMDNAIIVSLDEIKLLQFKNKFNVFDYKVIVKSQNDKGLDIK